MLDRLRAAFGAALVGVTSTACDRCGSDDAVDLDAALPVPRATVIESPSIRSPERLPSPELPALAAVDTATTTPRGGIALPRGCHTVGVEHGGPALAGIVPLVRAPAPGSVVLLRRDKGQTTAGGLASAIGEAEPKMVALPRTDRDPILETNGAATLVAWTRALQPPEAPAPNSMRELALLDLDATTAVRLAEGDGLVVADMRCAAWGCAILTSRAGRVRGAGAEVFVKPSGSPSWMRVTLETAGQESSDPIALSVSEAEPGGATEGAGGDPAVFALVTEAGETLSFRVPLEGAPDVATRLPTPYGVVAARAGSAPAVLAHASPPSSDGCMPGEGVDWVHAGGVARWPAPVPPESASVDPLERGSLVTYLAPLRCDQPRRVLYAAVIDERGAPVAAPIPVTDATAYAVSSHGDDVELWIWQGSGGTEPSVLRWLRARCAPPIEPPMAK